MPSCCLKSKEEEEEEEDEDQTQMNGDVVSDKQYSLPLLGNQRKEMNIIRSNHNPPKSVTNNVEGEGDYLRRRRQNGNTRQKIWHRVTRNYCYGVVSGL